MAHVLGNIVPESRARWADAESTESLEVVDAVFVSDNTDLLGNQAAGGRRHPTSGQSCRWRNAN